MDEKDDVGRVSSSVAESAVGVSVAGDDESVRKDLGSEGKVEGSCNGGEGDEIMVEVVGSDVFVDGVGGHEEGLGKEGSEREAVPSCAEADFRSREVADAAGREWDVRHETRIEGCQEMAVSLGERAELGSEKVEVVAGVSSEQDSVVSVEESEDRVSNETVVEEGGARWNTQKDGESFDGHNSSVGGLTVEKVAASDVLNTGIESGNVPSSVSPEPTSAHTSCVGEKPAVATREEDCSGRDEALHDGVANANLPLSGETQNSAIETGTHPTNEDSFTHALSELSENPAEAASVLQVEGVNNELSDNAALNTVSGGISEDFERAGADCSASGFSTDHTQIESCQLVAADVNSVNQDSGGLATERKQSSTPDHISGYVEDLRLTVEGESDPKSEAVISAEEERSSLETQVVGKEEIPVVKSKCLSIGREDPSLDSMDRISSHPEDSCGVNAEIAHGDVGIHPTNPNSPPKTSSVTEGGEGVESDINEVLAYDDKAPGIDGLNGKLSCSKSDEDTKIVKLVESSENDVVSDVASGHGISNGEPTQTVDGDTVTLEKDEFLNSEGEADAENRHAIATNVHFDTSTALTSSDKDLLEADTRTSAGHIVVEGENEVIDVKNTTVAEVLDGDKFARDDEMLNGQQLRECAGNSGSAVAVTGSLDEHINAEISKEEVDTDGNVNVPAFDNSNDPKMSLLETEENIIGEMVVVGEAEHVGVHDSSLDAQAGTYNANSSGANPVFVEQYVEVRNLEVGEEQAEAVIGMADPSQGRHVVNTTDVEPASEVDVTMESGSAVSSARLSGEGLEENVHLSNNELPEQHAERSLESHKLNVVNSHETVNQDAELEDESCKMNNVQDVHVHLAAEAEFLDCQPGVEFDANGDQVGHSGELLQIDEHSPDTNHPKILSDKKVNPGGSLKLHESGYLLPPENEGQFSVSDLVWGKVRSHPWWPGQIFYPADASEKAVKHFKKDCFLIAYFGDRTFAWNDASVLRPFRSSFSQIEKQSTSETFQNAVSSALAEVSRRVELGLTCPCIPRDVSEKLEYQIVENTGIREESTKQKIKDISCGATSFEPGKLIDYIRGLAQSPSGRIDRLDVKIARAQVVAFCHYKGYRAPPEFLPGNESLENNTDLVDHEIKEEQNLSNRGPSQKRKHDMKDSLQPRKKERSLSELMGDMDYFLDAVDDLEGKALGRPILSSSGRKIKSVDSLGDGSDKRISIYSAKVSMTTSTTPKPSFKIGECIRRVASQLTGSASFKSNGDQPQNDLSPPISESSEKGSIIIPSEFSSLSEMLSLLKIVAQSPRERCSFSSEIITFFSCFRSSVVLGGRPNSLGGKTVNGRKRKTSHEVIWTAEEFEFDDANDSYWTDRVVQNYSEEQLLQNGENDGGEYQLVVSDHTRPLKSGRRTHARKRYSSGNYDLEEEEPFEYIDVKKQKSSPAELVLNFAEGSLPSETNLNKIFRRFGTLKESETEVDCESRRAKIVFKRGSDAEVAYSSAGVVNIFGSMLVTYQLSYSPSSSLKGLPPAILPGQQEAT